MSLGFSACVAHGTALQTCYTLPVKRFQSLLLGLLSIFGGSYTASLILPIEETILDYAASSGTYRDGPFEQSQAVAINLLTNLGAITGNPDGTFRPGRRLNRAEFLKVAFLSHPFAQDFVW